MIIVKTQEFSNVLGANQDIANFINKNNIKEEDIIAINEGIVLDAKRSYTIFFYGDSETKEITSGFFGW